MIYYLRTKNNKDVAEVSVYTPTDEFGRGYIEIKSSVDIRNYSIFLLDLYETLNKDTTIVSDAIKSFELVNDLDDWLYQSYLVGKRNESNYYQDVNSQVKETLETIAKRFNLFVVED